MTFELFFVFNDITRQIELHCRQSYLNCYITLALNEDASIADSYLLYYQCVQFRRILSWHLVMQTHELYFVDGNLNHFFTHSRLDIMFFLPMLEVTCGYIS